MIAAIVALAGASLVVIAKSAGLFGKVGVKPRLIGACALWLVAAASVWMARGQNGFDLARAGLWTFGARQIGYGLLFGVLGLLCFPVYILIAKKLGSQQPDKESLLILSSASFGQRLFLLITAAGAEEILFRAVAIGSLMAAGVPHFAAVTIPLVVFVLMHRSSWSWLHLLFVTVAGALMTGAFIMGGVGAAILAHFIVDAPMMLAGNAMANKNWNAKIQSDESP
jgi:membrane protease YdiL (CAAX protease family)